MKSKYNIEYIRQFFKENGCELLEDTYINSRTKMKYRCKCGNESYILWSNFKKGVRCLKCSGHEKPTIEFLKQYFSERGCELLDTEYVNAKTPLRYICSCGNESTTFFRTFKAGGRCIKCGGREKLSFDFVKQYFTDHGCELLSTEYTNFNSLLDYKCLCGNVSKISFNNFKAGCRCFGCGGKEKFTYDYVKQYFEDNKCVLLSTEYINIKNPLNYICSCGNISKICFDTFKHGSRCKKCGLEKNSGQNHHAWKEDRVKFEEDKLFKLRIRKTLYACLKKLGKPKSDHTEQLLGYTAKQLQEHITNHPNYEKVKNGKWHLDHILPVQAFIDHKIYDAKLINSLDNLQPLSQRENCRKKDFYMKEDLIKFCNTHGVDIQF
jgi:hypothetical protein